MAIMNPMERALQAEDLGDRLKISLHPPRQWFSILFMSVWLTGWVVGEVFVTGSLLNSLFEWTRTGAVIPDSGGTGGMLFLVVWLFFWTLGGAFAIGSVAYQLIGREVIEASNDELVLSRQVLGIGRRRHYNAVNIDGLLLLRAPLPAGLPGFAAQMLGGPRITFTYGAQTVIFAASSRSGETEQALEAIQSRFPRYRTTPAVT